MRVQVDADQMSATVDGQRVRAEDGVPGLCSGCELGEGPHCHDLPCVPDERQDGERMRWVYDDAGPACGEG